jgi:hypothetical protein
VCTTFRHGLPRRQEEGRRPTATILAVLGDPCSPASSRVVRDLPGLHIGAMPSRLLLGLLVATACRSATARENAIESCEIVAEPDGYDASAFTACLIVHEHWNRDDAIHASLWQTFRTNLREHAQEPDARRGYALNSESELKRLGLSSTWIHRTIEQDTTRARGSPTR